MTNKTNKISIVGAGPSGLFASYLLIKRGFEVHLFDHMSGVGKKFLVAGKGGLNLTHSEPIDEFVKRYDASSPLIESIIRDFTPKDLISFCDELGVETFVGSSGRVFPKSFKAADILKKITNLLKENSNFHLHLKHSLKKIQRDSGSIQLGFSNSDNSTIIHHSDKVILALGGGSWKKTGSDGKWISLLQKLDIKVSPLRASNVGYLIKWSEILKSKLNHRPLKNIALKINDITRKGELMITDYGLEGGAIYALTIFIQRDIHKDGEARVFLDLRPDLLINQLVAKLETAKFKKTSLSNTLRKVLKFNKNELVVFNEFNKFTSSETQEIAHLIKNIPFELSEARPIDEAISTSGGVQLDQMSEYLEIKNLPGIYITGEMLDFDAPTGGYLLQAAFASAYRTCQGISNSIDK